MWRPLPAAFLAALMLPAAPVYSQSPIVGTWEMVSHTTNGKPTQFDVLPSGLQRGAVHYIFTGDGHYSLITFPTGRPAAKPWTERTREDWLAQCAGAIVQFGTFVIAGDQMTMKGVATLDSQNEGREWVRNYQVEGDTLTFKGKVAEGEQVVRYKRLK